MRPFPNEPDRAEWTTDAGLRAVVKKQPGYAYGFVLSPIDLRPHDLLPLPKDLFEDGFCWAGTSPGEPSTRRGDRGWVGFYSRRSLDEVQDQCEVLAGLLSVREVGRAG